MMYYSSSAGHKLTPLILGRRLRYSKWRDTYFRLSFDGGMEVDFYSGGAVHITEPFSYLYADRITVVDFRMESYIEHGTGDKRHGTYLSLRNEDDDRAEARWIGRDVTWFLRRPDNWTDNNG